MNGERFFSRPLIKTWILIECWLYILNMEILWPSLDCTVFADCNNYQGDINVVNFIIKRFSFKKSQMLKDGINY